MAAAAAAAHFSPVVVVVVVVDSCIFIIGERRNSWCSSATSYVFKWSSWTWIWEAVAAASTIAVAERGHSAAALDRRCHDHVYASNCQSNHQQKKTTLFKPVRLFSRFASDHILSLSSSLKKFQHIFSSEQNAIVRGREIANLVPQVVEHFCHLLLSWKAKEKSLYKHWLLLVLWLGVLCLPSCLPQLSDGDVVSCVPINMQPAVVNAKLLKVQVISQPCHSLSANLSRKSKQNHCKIYYKRLFYLKRISRECHVLAYWRRRARWHIRKSFGDSVSSIRIDQTCLKTLLFE